MAQMALFKEITDLHPNSFVKFAFDKKTGTPILAIFGEDGRYLIGWMFDTLPEIYSIIFWADEVSRRFDHVFTSENKDVLQSTN